MRFSSPTKAMVLMGASDPLRYTGEEMFRCSHVRLKEADCKVYLGTQTMNTEMYEIPLKAQFSDEKTGLCHISYHAPSKRRPCPARMLKFFSSGSQQPRIYPLTKTSLLVDTSGPDSKKIMAPKQNHKVKGSQRTCLKI